MIVACRITRLEMTTDGRTLRLMTTALTGNPNARRFLRRLGVTATVFALDVRRGVWDPAAPTECWPWPGGRKDHDGYGAIKVDGVSRRTHLYAFDLAYGAIPVGMTVDHRCHVRDCCRPSHLRLLTRAENGARHNQRKGSQK